MSIVESAVIAAAGLGSRLGLGKPKCLLEFGGKSILQHQLWLLRSVPDVRVVVGFEESLVMDAARRFRPDAIIVRNAAYRTTTTLDSYSLGAAGVHGNCLFLDGDITFGPASFARFLDTCRLDQALIGVTALKTQDAVCIGVVDGQAIWFSRERQSAIEWANLAWIPPSWLDNPTGESVFERLAGHLPQASCEVESYEVDTPADYTIAESRALEIFQEMD
jgi:choline kinase